MWNIQWLTPSKLFGALFRMLFNIALSGLVKQWQQMITVCRTSNNYSETCPDKWIEIEKSWRLLLHDIARLIIARNHCDSTETAIRNHTTSSVLTRPGSKAVFIFFRDLGRFNLIRSFPRRQYKIFSYSLSNLDPQTLSDSPV